MRLRVRLSDVSSDYSPAGTFESSACADVGTHVGGSKP